MRAVTNKNTSKVQVENLRFIFFCLDTSKIQQKGEEKPEICYFLLMSHVVSHSCGALRERSASESVSVHVRKPQNAILHHLNHLKRGCFRVWA